MPSEKFKHLLFYTIVVSGSLLLLEGMSFIALQHYQNGGELFNVRDFTELVPDQRFVTMKKEYDLIVKEGTGNWRVTTNSIGTRVPPSFSISGLLSPTPKFLFMGDSVPFGWGLDGEDSVANLLAEQHSTYVFINGAIPSYSLAQAVSRYEHEFRELTNVKYIFLQIYDPVSQYALMGSNWNENDNWTNFPAKVAALNCFGNINEYKLNFFKLLSKACLRFIRRNTTKPTTSESDERLARHVRDQLKELKALAPLNAHLVVAPVTPSPRGLKALNSDYLHSLNIVNNALELSCQEFKCFFVDTRAFLISDSDFIDECCHLSRQGSEKLRIRISSIINTR
jgi:hypothetical protein